MQLPAQVRAELWTDDTVYPCSTAMRIALIHMEAHPGLVSEWQEFTSENSSNSSDWMCYATWLEVELEVTLDHLTNVDIGTAIDTLERAAMIARELQLGVPNASAFTSPQQEEETE